MHQALLGQAAFRVYGAGFALLAFSRGFFLVGLAVSDGRTVPIPEAVSWSIAAVLLVPVVWLFHSIWRYFGFAHALGADHFFEEHRQRPLCRKGIFRLVPHAMYAVGFLTLRAPAVGLASRAALVVAGFNHAYIWVHYLCTERPDLRVMYGKESYTR